eukprot:gb/GECG01003228.1/.p1 GENE.gb/GECG01003228.1/~~gb/GECG01003228.1/.p1  ORF type:complete len:409 (+),score=34.58 gb/GECG01003228.1/:1-1227(+)
MSRSHSRSGAKDEESATGSGNGTAASMSASSSGSAVNGISKSRRRSSRRRVHEGKPRRHEVGAFQRVVLDKTKAWNYVHNEGAEIVTQSRRRMEISHLLNSTTDPICVLRGHMHYRDYYTPDTANHSTGIVEDRDDLNRERIGSLSVEIEDDVDLESSLANEELPRSMFDEPREARCERQSVPFVTCGKDTCPDAGTDCNLYPIRDLSLRALARHISGKKESSLSQTPRLDPDAGREPSDMELLYSAHVPLAITEAFGFPSPRPHLDVDPDKEESLDRDTRSKLANEINSDTVLRVLSREALRTTDALLTVESNRNFIPQRYHPKGADPKPYRKSLLGGFQYMFRSGMWSLPNYSPTNPEDQDMVDDMSFKRALYHAFLERFRSRKVAGAIYDSIRPKCSPHRRKKKP